MIFERNIQELLNFDYDNLKSYLFHVKKEQCMEILSNEEIKHKLIDTPKRHNFIWLAQEQNEYIIPYLLDGKGIDILKNTIEVEDKLNGIITSGQDYVKELFKNKEFVKLILHYENSLNYLFSGIISEGAYNFVRELINMNVDNKLLSKTICSLNKEAQIMIIKNLDIPNEIFWDLIINMKPEAADILMQNNSVGKKLNNLTLKQLNLLFEQKISIPSDILEDKEFIRNITTMLDIKTYRILINNLSEANDSELIEKKRKQYYEMTINSFDKKTNMLEVYYNLYLKLKNVLNSISIKYGSIYFSLINIMENILDFNYLYDLDSRINALENINNETLLAFCQTLSNLELTNMIIDYHFEDVYFNVLKDIEILLKFYESGGISLTNDEYQLYKNILHLDDLAFDEKIKLHEEMKAYNLKEKFYDDIRNAKNKSYQMINQEILNEKKLKEYQNEELSNKYGVNIYVLDGQPFKALVKSFNDSKSYVLGRYFSHNNSLYGSFSLDGSEKLQIFTNPREYYNILYESLNEEQVIHTFSVDSFTSRPSKYDNNLTDRFNEILTPESIINNSDNYNEILIRQASESRPSEIDERIPVPKMVSLYCYDEITPFDIESAKALGIGITVVLTRNYSKKTNIDRINMFDTMTLGNSNNFLENNYLNNMEQDAMHGRL